MSISTRRRRYGYIVRARRLHILFGSLYSTRSGGSLAHAGRISESNYSWQIIRHGVFNIQERNAKREWASLPEQNRTVIVSSSAVEPNNSKRTSGLRFV